MKVKKVILFFLLTAFALTTHATEYYQATADLKVRTGAGKEYPVSFTLKKGDEVEVLSKNGSWYKIKYLEETGYAYSKYLKPAPGTNIYTSEGSGTGNSLFGILFFVVVIGFLWLLPILIIISSRKTTVGEKIAWVLAVIFISWFAWVFYMLLAPIKKKE
jgi:Bacterial SH3 domain